MSKSKYTQEDRFQRMDFEKLSKESRSVEGRIRCLAMRHLQEGKSISETARIVKKSRVTVYAWLKRIQTQDGAQGLISPAKGRGRKNKASAYWKVDTLKELLEQAYQQRAGGSLSALDIKELIKEKWDVQYSLSGVYWNLHRLGFSWVTARSKHPKSDPHAQEAFKKTLLSE